MAAEIPQILKTHCKLRGGGEWKEDELLEESGKKLRLNNNFDLDVFALVSWEHLCLDLVQQQNLCTITGCCFWEENNTNNRA